MKGTVGVVFFCIFFEFVGYFYGCQPSDVVIKLIFFNKSIKLVEREYDVSFRFEIDQKEYPAFWEETGNSNSSAIGLADEIEASRFYFVVKRELEKYPPSLVVKELKSIYALESLVVGGDPVGGTYDPNGKSIFIKAKNKHGRNASKFFIGKAFHHEFSSILLRNFNFNKLDWKNAFEEGFLYRSEENPFYYMLLNRGEIDEVSDGELYLRGLLRQYAETGLENDFNVYAEVVFTDPRKMKKLISQYPVIKRKYEVFKSFYLSIDQGFAPVFEKIDG